MVITLKMNQVKDNTKNENIIEGEYKDLDKNERNSEIENKW